ncbi:molybdopterin-binding domain-containing protein (plasmid) [Sinorhizobium fredii]|uniref:Molybdopterin-binding domain-containing protein n=1 Tax=Rhizobium fredii TaxID=380 RepID=A0A2L0HCY5_RHIFR|nr:molybdopterin-binding domain-containing protein [Sinorhizobium fredii]
MPLPSSRHQAQAGLSVGTGSFHAGLRSLPETNKPSRPCTSHWGAFSVRRDDRQLSHAGAPDPIYVVQNFSAALHQSARVAHTMVRKGWLENGRGPDEQHGLEECVPLNWDAPFDLLSNELVRDGSGGCYSWQCAGRFRAQRLQLPEHRLLRLREIGRQLFLRVNARSDPPDPRRS